MKKQTANVSIPVINLKYFGKNKFESLPKNKVFNLIIDYPCTPTTFKINTGKSGLNLLQLLNKIGACYSKIYENTEKYKVWGHDIDDLSLENIQINFDSKTIRLLVDS